MYLNTVFLTLKILKDVLIYLNESPMSLFVNLCFSFFLTLFISNAHATDLSLEIKEQNENYAKFSRSKNPSDLFLEYKFAQQFWRLNTLHKILDQNFDEDNIEDILTNLKNLQITLTQTQLSLLHEKVKIFLTSNKVKQLYISFLEDSAASKFLKEKFSITSNRAGPEAKLNFIPIKPSKYDFNKWSKIINQDKYLFEDGGVRFHGILFRPGDHLVTSLNMDADGLYTTFSTPLGHFSHAGFFAILESENKKLPVVIEIYERGVRAVPLNVFTSPEFSSYIEIYRYNSLSEQTEKKINETALSLMNTVHGYNFYTEDDDTLYLTCTRVGALLMEKSGVVPVPPRSKIIHPMTLKNFERLGFVDKVILAPIDFTLSKKVRFINFIDNNQFFKDASRQLIVKKIQNLFETKNLNLEDFPFSVKLNKWGIEQVQKRTFFLAQLFRAMEGFNKNNFPKGPIYLMALVEPLEEMMGEVTQNSLSDITSIIDQNSRFSLKSSYENDEINRIIESHLNEIQSLFYN